MRRAPAAVRKVPPVAFALALISALGGCHSQGTVVRIVDGREVHGRQISPEAYAATLEGALAEASGDVGGARRAYEHAVDEDSGNAEAWARLGSLMCTTDRARANEALTRATDLDPESSDAWLARARCELRRGELPAAERSALRAVASAPDDRDANDTYGEALRRSGRREEARRWLLGFGLFARRRAPDEPDGSVEAALDGGDEIRARDAAIAHRLSTPDLALIAIRRGKLAIARSAAEKALAAEPENADALVAALAATDLAGDPARFDELLRRAGRTHTPLGADATRLLGELLSRRSTPAGAGRR